MYCGQSVYFLTNLVCYYLRILSSISTLLCRCSHIGYKTAVMLSMRKTSEEHVMQALFTIISEGSTNDNSDGENKYPTVCDILIHNESYQKDELFHTFTGRM
jgi:hypothetical protein